MDDYGQRLAEQLVIEVKAAMARAGITSSRALGRAIGASSQYMSSRLDGGNPRTGERVPLNVHDVADIAEALGLVPHELLERAEIALEHQDHGEPGRVVEFGRERRPEIPEGVPLDAAALYHPVSHHDADVEREEMP